MRKLWEKIRWILRGFKRTLIFLSRFWDDRYYTEVDMDRWRSLGAKIGKDVQIQHLKVDERFARLLEIEEELGRQGQYAGRDALKKYLD